MLKFSILVIIAYLLGSVPFGLLIVRAYGKDLRKIGSGNIGATNVARALGKNWAYMVFLLDALKGFVPMLAGKPMISTPPSPGRLWLWLAVGCAAMLGHVFPIYLGGKGGKGVATGLGVMLGLYTYYTASGLSALAVWLAAVVIWRYVSLGSILAAVAFPVSFIILTAAKDSWRFDQLWPLATGAFAMATLVIVRHRGNIKRLLNGAETKTLSKIKKAGQ